MKRLRAGLYFVFQFQRGRPIALALLILLLNAAWLSEGRTAADLRRLHDSPILAAMAAPFSALRQMLFDGYLRTFPRERLAQPVSVIEIDESSLRRLGQWPWPRTRLADLVDAIATAKPAAVGLDVYMPEADQTSPERVAANLADRHPALARALNQLPSHDARLARALQQAPTVLGAAGFDFDTMTTQTGLRSVPILVSGGDPLLFARRYPQVLASLPQLQAAAHGQGVATVETDESVVRRVPMVVAVGDQLVPSLAMEMLRIGSQSSNVEVLVGGHGIQTVGTGDLAVQTQRGGDVWLHFAKFAEGQSRRFSAIDVLDGKVPAEAITGKLVLIGLTGSGLNDMRMTARGELVPGVEIQAQILESFFDGRFLVRPWWMKYTELALLAGMGLVMIGVVPRARVRFAKPGGIEPNGAGWLVLGVNGFFVASGFFVFWKWGLLFDSTASLIGSGFLMANLVFSSLLEIETDNRDLANEQQLLVEEAARVSGELAAARRIQLASLPDPLTAFPGEQRFHVAATLEPARESGGDLYDFFMIDARHLCFVIGDVSGKGMAAAVFMAMTKTLTKSLALRMAGGPDRIVAAANADLSRENSEMLFVTLLLGVLDIETGELVWVNAGHDSPWHIDRHGAAKQVEALPGAGGPPLCMLEDFAYAPQRMKLAAGDTLCLLTDGITEAMNPQGEMYGRGRLQSLLDSRTDTPTAATQAARIRSDVALFVNGAEPSDDLTLLVLRWDGPTASAA